MTIIGINFEDVILIMKKYSYYFTVDTDDSMNDYGEEYMDDDDWAAREVENAKYIYLLYSNTPLTSERFEEMVDFCVKNIANKNSKVFDYPDDLDEYSKDDLIFNIDCDDVVDEMQDIYGVDIACTIAPMIWSNCLWETDENYNDVNPPELWRMVIKYEI